MPGNCGHASSEVSTVLPGNYCIKYKENKPKNMFYKRKNTTKISCNRTGGLLTASNMPFCNVFVDFDGEIIILSLITLYCCNCRLFS